MFLLDTMVISELRKKKVNDHVAQWFNDVNDSEIFLSVITIGEIRKGICKRDKENQSEAKELSFWLDRIISHYFDRILPITNDIALEWGKLSYKIGNAGADNMLAATAIIHGLTVVTRNVCHFECTGATYFNPWS